MGTGGQTQSVPRAIHLTSHTLAPTVVLEHSLSDRSCLRQRAVCLIGYIKTLLPSSHALSRPHSSQTVYQC